MTKEEAQNRADYIWQEILDNEEEIMYLRRELEELFEQFPDLD